MQVTASMTPGLVPADQATYRYMNRVRVYISENHRSIRDSVTKSY